MQELLQIGVVPRALVVPLVALRRCSWNYSADKAAAHALQEKSDFDRTNHPVASAYKFTDSRKILQVHTDGACLSVGGPSAAAYTLTLWSFDSRENPLRTHRGVLNWAWHSHTSKNRQCCTRCELGGVSQQKEQFNVFLNARHIFNVIRLSFICAN